jgi:chromosome segregation ATPase
MAEITEAELLSQAAAFDAGTTDHNEAPPVEVQAESEPTETPAQAEAPKESPEPAAEKQETDKVVEAEAPKQGTPDKAQTKLQKDLERRNKTWQEINSTREELKREREEIAKLKEEFQRERESARAQIKEVYKDEHGFTQQDYLKAAESFEAAGDDDSAELARKAAARADKAAKEHSQKAQQERFVSEWRKTYEDCCQTEPALKDQNSDLYKEVLKTIESFPPLKADPKGILYALQAVKLSQKAKAAEAMEKELKELKGQYEKLNQKTSVAAGVVPAKSQPKGFEQMSVSEKERYLRAKAVEIDGEPL